ncbi:MAG: pyridoxal phosphate-dependent aminotransferase [Spirochaetota bacterium]
MTTNRLTRALQRRREAGGAGLDLMDTNFHNCGFFFPRGRLEELLAAYPGAQHYRPDPKGNPELRHTIAGYYREAGHTVDPEHLIVTASTSDAYNLLFSALAEPGDNIVLPSPGYPLFEYLAQFHSLETRFYHMHFDTAFTLNGDQVARHLDGRTRFVAIVSPNNPTGRIYTEGELDSVTRLCGSRGIPVICDEVFSEYRYAAAPADGEAPGTVTEAAPLPRPAALAPDVPTVTLNGISKLLALPDLKLGWMAVGGPEAERGRMVHALEVANDMFLNVSGPAQYVAAHAIPERRRYLEPALLRLTAARDALVKAVAEAPELEVVPPDGGIHAALRLPPGLALTEEEVAVALIERHGVHLHPGYLYGIDDDRTLILSLLPGEAAIRTGVEAIHALLRKL